MVKAQATKDLNSIKNITDIADNTAQHFWFNGEGLDTGAHITEVPQEEWNDSTSGNYHKGPNLLARSTGIAIRNGMTELAKFSSSGVQVGQSNGAHSIFSSGSLDFYDGSKPITSLAAGNEEIYGDIYLTSSFSTETSASNSKVAVRHTVESSKRKAQLLLLATDDGVNQTNRGEIRSTGEMTFDYNGTPIPADVDSWLFVGSNTGHGFELNSVSEQYDSTQLANEVDATISADCSLTGSDSQMLMMLGSDYAYTGIRIRVNSKGRKGPISFECANLYSDVALVVVSDKALKEHEAYLGEDAIDFIRDLKPARYIKDGKEHLGFYAQDVKESNKWYAELTPKVNDEYMGLSYTELLAPLVAYCQQLEQRIKELEP